MVHVARTDPALTLDVTLEERLTVTPVHEQRIYLPLVLLNY